MPQHTRSDNGPEFIATDIQKWLKRVDVRALYIAPASPFRLLAYSFDCFYEFVARTTENR